MLIGQEEEAVNMIVITDDDLIRQLCENPDPLALTQHSAVRDR